MQELVRAILDNLAFFATCAAIVVALFVLAKLVERRLTLHRTSPARRVSIIGICSALATVLHILDFPLVFLAPEFYKLDFSELPDRKSVV